MAKKKKPVPAESSKTGSKKKKPAAKKKPIPAVKKKPEPAAKEKPESAAKKKPEPAAKKKPELAAKKKPEPAKMKKKASAGKQKPEKPSVRNPLPGTEILRRVLIAALAVLVVCAGVLSGYSLHGERLQQKLDVHYTGILQRDNLYPIAFEDEQVKAHVRATKRHGQTGAFTFFCNKTLRLSNVNMTGFIVFGNPADNACALVLTILDKDGNRIYRSGGVEPGQYISRIHPSVEWEDGDYACTAYVSAFRGEGKDYRCIGVQYTRLTVKVGETS